MARISHIVIPNQPHHIVHRGNHREKVFINDIDKQIYLDYLNKYAKEAGIVRFAEEYPWSIAKAHVYKRRDDLLSDNFMIQEIADWREYLSEEDVGEGGVFTSHAETGRPLGDSEFIKRVEKITGRFLQKNRPGPKKKN